jgi:hypothetical protein
VLFSRREFCGNLCVIFGDLVLHKFDDPDKGGSMKAWKKD